MSDNLLVSPEQLENLLGGLKEPFLAYLNLPPVGAIADNLDFAPIEGETGSFELSPGLRTSLLERRGANGRFSSLADLVGVDGLTTLAAKEIVERLSDLTRYGHRVRPVWGGPESEREFFALLESATRYIHISTYIVGGAAGLKLARLLARKQAQGVEVRLSFCMTGFVVSGSPSGTGFVSGLSEMRSWALNDMYARKAILRELVESKIPHINNVPIGIHWKRRDFRERGIKTEKSYYAWARTLGIDEAWIEEQRKIDSECSFGFANVDHRKLVIVDGEKAFVGSQNIADSYFYSNELSEDPKVNRKNWQWHDNSAIVEGGIVRELNRLFASRWMLCGGDVFDPEDSAYSPPPKRVGNAVVTSIATIPGLRKAPWSINWAGFLMSLLGGDRRPITIGANPIQDRLLALPTLATSDFYVEHCYPADPLIMEKWAGMASKVPGFHFVVPHHYDTFVLGKECDRYYPAILNAGVELHGYDRAIMHSKILVMDGYYVATGSYNLNPRSARADLENELFIQCNDYGRAVRERIAGDLELCSTIHPSAIDKFRSRRSIPVFDALLRYFVL